MNKGVASVAAALNCITLHFIFKVHIMNADIVNSITNMTINISIDTSNNSNNDRHQYQYLYTFDHVEL